jgi:hypothetical protein
MRASRGLLEAILVSGASSPSFAEVPTSDDFLVTVY